MNLSSRTGPVFLMPSLPLFSEPYEECELIEDPHFDESYSRDKTCFHQKMLLSNCYIFQTKLAFMQMSHTAFL